MLLKLSHVILETSLGAKGFQPSNNCLETQGFSQGFALPVFFQLPYSHDTCTNSLSSLNIISDSAFPPTDPGTFQVSFNWVSSKFTQTHLIPLWLNLNRKSFGVFVQCGAHLTQRLPLCISRKYVGLLDPWTVSDKYFRITPCRHGRLLLHNR